ncbi:hypothetical protein MTR67_030749 [Solanum verrucosum]|uniref:Integrase zinc-binding domain-containing protein n=1 Tax=Solanum verrucosum TaxID=315347 RepID=A0AAF0U164_SOLVR|nr:hypothetical protein MTR67_030749 [Solanum verrucosum]
MKAKKDLDLVYDDLRNSVSKKAIEDFSKGGDDLIRYQGRLCIQNDDELRNQILIEAHSSRYSIHPGATNMYHDLWKVYWWNGMKKDITECVGPELVHEAMEKTAGPSLRVLNTDRQRPPGRSVERSIAHREGVVKDRAYNYEPWVMTVDDIYWNFGQVLRDGGIHEPSFM